MAKYKVLKPFKDIHTKKSYQVNDRVVFDLARYKEIEKNLEAFGGGYLELVESKTKTTVEKKTDMNKEG